jgi:hypothetical protein
MLRSVSQGSKPTHHIQGEEKRMAKRRSFIRAFFGALGIALIALMAANTMVSAAAPGIRWSGTDNLSDTGSKSVYPVVAVDGAGKNHIAWLEYTGDESPNSRLMYTNNVGGSYRGAYEVTDDAGKNKDHILAIAIENNRVHLAYTDRNAGVSHTVVNLDNGRPSTGSTTRLSSGSAKGYEQSLTVDTQGRVHAAWIENRSGDYRVYHRVWSNGSWEGSDRLVRSGGDDQTFPSLASTDNGRVHILFKNGSRMFYGYYQNGGWESRSLPSNDSVNQTALAADGTRVYAVWSTRDHVVKYNAGVDGDWSGTKTLSLGGQWSDQPSVFFSPANNRVYVVWAARLSSSGNTSVLVREVNQGNVSSDAWKIGDAPGNWPRGAGGSSGIHVVWQDKSRGAEEAYIRSGVPGDPSGGESPGAPAPSATPGAPTTTPTTGPSVTPTTGPTVTPSPVPTGAPTATPPPSNAPATGSFDFADTAFRNVWTRTDSLVAGNAVPYSWIWGPAPFTGGVGEYYVQSPNQARSVQYFDKSRMEINNPSAARDQWYVTNGRLTDELITGLMQVGDAQYEQRQPAAIPAAGDRQNTFPTYGDLRSVYRQSYNSDRANQELYRAPDGTIRTQLLSGANSDPSMVISQRINGLGIPKVFWDYMNQPGQVVENGTVVNANPLYDWRYVVGEPLTEAYWTFIKVGGVDHGVLVQAFERRVLTYQPDNPPEFQVEMGNIGRHYFEWRYGVIPR